MNRKMEALIVIAFAALLGCAVAIGLHPAKHYRPAKDGEHCKMVEISKGDWRCVVEE
jgi:hypothetical protein